MSQGISTRIRVQDGMSGPLRSMTKALNVALAGFEAMQDASAQAVDISSIHEAQQELAAMPAYLDAWEDEIRQAQEEQDRLNNRINRGGNAMDGLVKKALGLVSAYASLSKVKGWVTESLGYADTQINAQIQLRTVLNNMGAEASYKALVDEVDGNTLENSLTLDTSGAVADYEAMSNATDGAELGNVLTLDTSAAQASYDAFTKGLAGNQATIEVNADTTRAESAYDAILAKASDIQSRGIYGDEAMIAGAAEFATYFSDTKAILSMMDTLSNYAMGMSGGGELDTEAMVNYATGLGKIMSGSYDAMTKKGFEFSDAQKAIIDGTASQAQVVSELGAEYANMSHDMQAAAVIGSVIDEGWADLYETMSNTPQGQIIQFKNTLGDLKEVVGAGLYPAVLGFVGLFRDYFPQIEALAGGFVNTVGLIITGITNAADMALRFSGFIHDNWSIVSPIVWGIVAAMAAYAVVSGVVSAANAIHATSEATKAAAEMMATGATFAETAAQHGLNAALMACPITWIVLGVLAFVAALVAVCSWIAKTTGAAQSAFGIITGCIFVVGATFKNLGMLVANIALGIWDALGAVCTNIEAGFHNAISGVQGWFYDLLSTALKVVDGICAALNKLPFVEFDYSGISGKASEYASKAAEAYANKEEYASVADAFNGGFNTFDIFSDGWASNAFKAGAAWGDGIADRVGGLFSYDSGTIDDYTKDYGNGFALDGIANDTGNIADSANGIAKSLDASEEDLRYLRDLAEREAVNRFTTAEIKIDMQNDMKVSSGVDLNGMLNYLEEALTEKMEAAAAGVY